MKANSIILTVVLAILISGAPNVLAENTVSVVVVAPEILYTESDATVTVTAVNITDQTPAVISVVLRLKSSSELMNLFNGNTDAYGRLTAQFNVPDILPGTYTIEITAEGVEEVLSSQIQVRKMPVILIETDKPIYKPGQTIRGRILILNKHLRPKSGDASVEITDARGIKIFRKELTAGNFGVAPFELALASELNFGTWKITAQSGSSSTSTDIRVEKYVLPRFEVDLDMEKDYFIVDEQITGSVKAEYFFGKVVDGTVTVRASRYVGIWEVYAEYSANLSEGTADFVLPAAGYVAGTTGAGGAGNVQLEVVVTDTSAHEETTTRLLRIAGSSLNHQLISKSRVMIPKQPFEVMLIAETQQGVPVTATARMECTYYDQNWQKLGAQKLEVPSFNSTTTVLLLPPEGISSAIIRSTATSANDISADAELTVYAAYSPTASFLHISRQSDEPVSVGDIVNVDVFSTHASTVYYDIFVNGHTILSGFSTTDRITFQATQQMTPSAKVVAYIINPNNEVSADTLKFDVILDEQAALDVSFDAKEVLPGATVELSIQADAKAMVGIAIVDESVYALNEGRLNMQAVFDELERLFMEPQSETHDQTWDNGANGVFEDAGLQIITSEDVEVPQGRNIWRWDKWRDWAEDVDVTLGGGGNGLAEVTRVRQFFPETWLWMPEFETASDGSATMELTAPDSITTWRLNAVSTSNSGLGITQSELVVFQEFFGEFDLPYAVTRGEQFPVRVQIFNYLDEPQQVHVELVEADWFELLEDAAKVVTVEANAVGLASFLIEPAKLGANMLEVSLRSTQRADAIRKELLVAPEGTQRQFVSNGMIKAGESVELDTAIPDYAVAGSDKVLLSITPSLVAQTINGIEDLLQMPYGCGEQNMIFFAPDVEILRYLDATGQLTPEIRAKAHSFINAGYQRQLTYQRHDGSFSAFGDSDDSGSLWLTAFVLDVFSGARDVQTIDEGILADAAAWIAAKQLDDGSFAPVGFVHHKEMLGGLQGKYTLTAFATIALAKYGSADPTVMDKAIEYLNDNITTVWDDAYALAVTSLALVQVDDPAAETVLSRLLELAISDGDGIHWAPHAIETTAYVALAMIEREMAQASDAIKWISLQQNAQGGFGHTQDTVMAIKALMTAAQSQSRNIDLVLTAKESGSSTVVAQFNVDASNFDVLQIAEIPVGSDIEITAEGSGEVRYQLVRRFNTLLGDDCIINNMSLEVQYDAANVEVDDIVNVNVTVRYLGIAQSSGMMIVDVGVPTGFAVVQSTLDDLIESKVVSRIEVAGRKVIFYVDELSGGQQRTFTFQVKARFPVKAVIPDSKAYLYYEPEIMAEDQGRAITVGFGGQTTYGIEDLRGLAANWLYESQFSLTGDLNNDQRVNFEDFAILVQHWMQ